MLGYTINLGFIKLSLSFMSIRPPDDMICYIRALCRVESVDLLPNKKIVNPSHRISMINDNFIQPNRYRGKK